MQLAFLQHYLGCCNQAWLDDLIRKEARRGFPVGCFLLELFLNATSVCHPTTPVKYVLHTCVGVLHTALQIFLLAWALGFN